MSFNTIFDVTPWNVVMSAMTKATQWQQALWLFGRLLVSTSKTRWDSDDACGCNTVDGSEIRRSPVDMIHIPLFTWFYTSKRWWSPDFWTINSMSWLGCHSKQRDWVPKFYIFNWRVGDFFSPGMSWWLPCQKTTAMAWLSNPRLNKMSRASILCKMSWNSFILKTSNMWNIFFTSSASRINIIFAENSYSIAGSQMLLVNFHSALPYNVSQAHGSVAHQSFHLAWYQRNSRDWAWKNPWENQPDKCRWAMKKHLVV